MSLLSKLPIIAAGALLSASLSFAQTEDHPKPVQHKAPKAQKHASPKATAHPAPKVTKHKAPKAGHRGTSKKKKRGQQAIDNERATQIQEALVREHYLTGKPSGTWDSTTQEAMRRYQADHGWQNKSIPDSRALISLGLGPDHEHLLNPESAMTTEPQLPHGNGSVRPASRNVSDVAGHPSLNSPALNPEETSEPGISSTQSSPSASSAPTDLSGSH